MVIITVAATSKLRWRWARCRRRCSRMRPPSKVWKTRCKRQRLGLKNTDRRRRGAASVAMHLIQLWLRLLPELVYLVPSWPTSSSWTQWSLGATQLISFTLSVCSAWSSTLSSTDAPCLSWVLWRGQNILNRDRWKLFYLYLIEHISPFFVSFNNLHQCTRSTRIDHAIGWGVA